MAGSADRSRHGGRDPGRGRCNGVAVPRRRLDRGAGGDGTDIHRDTTVPSTPPPADLPEEAAFTLVPAAGVDPIRVSTVLGDIEFVTMQLPPNREFDFYAHLVATPDGPVLVTDRATTIRIHVDDRRNAVVIGGPPDLADDSDPSSASEPSRYSGLGANTRVASGPRGVVIASLSTISYSTDQSTFTEAERGPDLTISLASDREPRKRGVR